MDDIINLINQTRQQDECGVWRSAETKTQVFVKVESVSMAEFYEGGRNGLNPQYRFLMFHGDYEGQTVCEYNGLTYSIYRTYRRGDTVELYVERKGGTNGAADSNT